jgi:hypothetical protein
MKSGTLTHQTVQLSGNYLKLEVIFVHILQIKSGETGLARNIAVFGDL